MSPECEPLAVLGQVFGQNFILKFSSLILMLLSIIGFHQIFSHLDLKPRIIFAPDLVNQNTIFIHGSWSITLRHLRDLLYFVMTLQCSGLTNLYNSQCQWQHSDFAPQLVAWVGQHPSHNSFRDLLYFVMPVQCSELTNLYNSQCQWQNSNFCTTTGGPGRAPLRLTRNANAPLTSVILRNLLLFLSFGHGFMGIPL